MCVDFQDLNKANPKDDFPFTHIDSLVDNTVGHALPSFMDGFSVGMAIYIRPADTRPGPTLMGRILPGPIKNRVGYGFFKKNPKRVRVLLKNPKPDPVKTRLYYI